MKKVNIVIYKMTGWQLFFYVPEKMCEECDLSVAVVNRVVKKFPRDKVDVQIKKWFNNLPFIILKGGWHPPVTIVNGSIFSQGIVPDAKNLERLIRGII